MTKQLRMFTNDIFSVLDFFNKHYSSAFNADGEEKNLTKITVFSRLNASGV